MRSDVLPAWRDHPLFRFAVAAAGIVFATLVQFLLIPVVGNRFPFATLFLAVMFAAWSGGAGPALLATALGALSASIYLLPPTGSLRIEGVENQFGLLIFLLVSLGITSLGASMRRSHLAAHLAAQRCWEQAERLRITLASIGDGVIVTDQHSRIVSMNAVAERLTGWRESEVIDKDLLEIFRIQHVRTRAPVENPVTRALREGTIVGLANHTVLVSRTGQEVQIDDSASPIFVRPGEMIGCVLVFRDITEKYEAAVDHQRLSAIVESSNDAIIGEALDGTISSWNRAAERLYGYTAEEAIGQPIAMLAPPLHRKDIPEMLALLKQGEKIERADVVRMAKNGQLLNVSVTISPIHDSDNEVIGASKIVRDVTREKRHEAALQLLVDASKVLSGLIDPETALQTIAQRAVPAFADWCAVDLLTPKNDLSRVAVAHVDPRKVEVVRRLHRDYPSNPDAPLGAWHVLRTGRSEVVPELTQERLKEVVSDTKLRHLIEDLQLRSYLGVPLVVREKVIGVVSFVSAESGRLFDEEDLRLAEELAQRIGVALENARLYHELTDADHRKDEFLAMLAHELRNPLAPIRTGLEILALSESEDLETIQMMQWQVEHLVRLVDDLLDVSRIVRGRVELRKGTVELKGILRRSIDTVSSAIHERRQRLNVSIPDHPIFVEADPVRLTQVFENLLNNASKYTDPEGRIDVVVEPAPEVVSVRVRDTGIGIEPELLPKVFEIFTQSNRTLARSQGGLGIGLTLVERLIALHGGKVRAHSDGLGHGSTFEVVLPLATESEPPPDATQTVDPTLSSNLGSDSRVLIVDDNVDAARTLSLLLRRLNLTHVEVVHEGSTALTQAERFRPHLILLDIGLPGRDGLEIVQEMRRNPLLSSAMIVAITGYGQSTDRRKSLDAGFDEHLVKPVDLPTLRKLLADPRLSGKPSA